MVRLSCPSSSGCVANKGPSVWRVAYLASPGLAAAALTTRWRIDGSAGWLRRDGEAGARAMANEQGYVSALGPENSPESTPWGLLPRRSRERATGGRLLRIAPAVKRT